MITTVISFAGGFPDDFLAVVPVHRLVSCRWTEEGIIRTRRTGLTGARGRLSRRSSFPVLSFFFARKSITPPTSGTSISVKGWVGRGVLFSFTGFPRVALPRRSIT